MSSEIITLPFVSTLHPTEPTGHPAVPAETRRTIEPSNTGPNTAQEGNTPDDSVEVYYFSDCGNYELAIHMSNSAEFLTIRGTFIYLTQNN